MKPQRPSAFADAVPVDGRGRRSPQTRLLIDERDRLLIEAVKFYSGLSQREAARHLHTVLTRYQTGRWRRSRVDLTCPHDAGRLDAVLWMILRTRDHVPRERTIRAALSRSSPGLFVAHAP